jgi:hypothetical protein
MSKFKSIGGVIISDLIEKNEEQNEIITLTPKLQELSLLTILI